MKHTAICSLSHQTLPLRQLVPVEAIRPGLLEFIRSKYPDWAPAGYVSNQELNKLRHAYVQTLVATETNDVTQLEKAVLSSLNDDKLLTPQLNGDDDPPSTFGQRLADRVATFGGSWLFISAFGAILFSWIALNLFLALHARAFDPYPFILLNLVLSCLAAIQAPIIMMSQNRQEEKDRQRARNDYMINLKAEIEIRLLHEKMDHLIVQQMERLLEIQQVQLEMIEQLGRRP